MERREFIRLSLMGCACCLPACGGRGGAVVPQAVALREDMIPEGKFGRHIRVPLSPRYITVHSTGSPGGTAAAHARLLREGRIRAKSQWNKRGYNIWHFTVDDRESIQHMPLNEAGEHADHDGPGNATSIGVEICEFHDRDRQQVALERAARLVAWLRDRYGMPIGRVVPHYYWTMHRFHHWNKPCPRILMDDGRPGAKWAAWVRQVERVG